MDKKIQNGRELFSNLANDINNSELTEGQIALLTLEIQRIFTEEINKSKNTVCKLQKEIKNDFHTIAELKKMEKIQLIQKYEKELTRIKTMEHDALEHYIDELPNTHIKISETYVQFYKEYYNDTNYKTKIDIDSSNGSNALKVLDEALRGFKTQKLKKDEEPEKPEKPSE